MKLHAVKFGVAFGVIYAVIFLVCGLAGALFGWGGEFMKLVGDFYVGFEPTLVGAVIGAAWGFAIGFVFFGLGAWVYNVLLGRPAGGGQ